MVLGESEIQGQVREAWELAVEEGAAGPLLNRLFREALAAGKRVRTETAIATGQASVAGVAVRLAREAFADLPRRRVLVIGAGLVAEASARALVAEGIEDVTVANRTVSSARGLAERVGGRGVGFDRVAAELEQADIVISSTDAPHTILGRADLERVMGARAGRPIVLIDIAVPRDLDAEIAGLHGRAALRHRRPRAGDRGDAQRPGARGPARRRASSSTAWRASRPGAAAPR